MQWYKDIVRLSIIGVIGIIGIVRCKRVIVRYKYLSI